MTNETTHKVEMNTGEVRMINMQQWIKIIFISCIVAEVLLIVCDYVFNYMDIFGDKSIRRIWNIAREKSIPTWFSSIQAQILGVTVFLIAIVQAHCISRAKMWGWILIGMFFLWIGIDDFAEIHEKLGGALERMATKDSDEQGWFIGFFLKNPSFSWHTFIAPMFAVCGLGITIFLWMAFWRLNLIRYLVLGFGCWIVAQSIDFIEGLDDIDTFYNSIKDYFSIERKYFVTHTFKVVEEVLEMFGTTLLWIGFLHYFAIVANGLQIQLTQAGNINNTQ
ncbi:hypothetical protein [Candidatus Parabeggiatoa sp. HSG14]|uniref:hypothetical protein n=1 Tax=Candidatus Parabeggiatoa sp. HSG14 TaxID=3055593 RepID=UPI0025A74FA6|nr:hypothetical protein [Thiotrichales bacterium HSG14]